MNQLSQALRIDPGQVIAFTGAGGKTSALFACARELAPALVTSSTHLGVWQAELADRHFIWETGAPMPDFEPAIGAGVSLVTGSADAQTGRLRGLNEQQLESLRQVAGYHDLPLLIEADGSRMKPLKAPGPGEPVIPPFVDGVVVVAGLSGLGSRLDDEHVHRPVLFAGLSGLGLDEAIDVPALARVLGHPAGGLKNIPASARRSLLLNQADTPLRQSWANRLASQLLPVYDDIVISRLNDAMPQVYASWENVGAVILSGGAASYDGTPKQLLSCQGRSFVRIVAETSLAAGLAPVLVVTGAYDDEVRTSLHDLPVQLVHNPQWQLGQSSSWRAGLVGLPKKIGAAIFLAADQPQVSVELLRAMVERHRQDLPAVVAPYVFDQRSMPFLFDRVTFAVLATITGDAGGRAVFHRYSPRYLNWSDRRLLLNVDTPGDYQKIIHQEQP